MKHMQNRWWIGVMLVVAFTLSGGLTLAQDTQPCGTNNGEGCAPQSERVDLYEPTFSNPTNITNPLFPVSAVNKTLLLGHVDGLPLHVEYTLMPNPRVIEWHGQQIETLEVHYLAHIGGRIAEIALDWYAQDDQGAVWYFGEDVADYEEGIIVSRGGTWKADSTGPVALIMPADPQVGDVYRVENIPGVAFEEVTVVEVGVPLNGPFGGIDGGMIGRQLHMDGAYSNKTFAPGYGEFVTTNQHEIEAVALTVPNDVRPEPLPAELEALSVGATTIFDAAQAGDWDAVVNTVGTMTATWKTYQTGEVPRMVDAQMSNALIALVAAVDVRQLGDVSQAAVNVAQAGLDLQFLYQPVADIERARLGLWAQQVLIDVAADDPGAVQGDVATLEWIWKRMAYTLDSADGSTIEAQLTDLRVAADAEDFDAAADVATQLREQLAALKL